MNDPMPHGCRAEKRRQSLLEAATTLFLDKGFERTSVADIVGLAGGSRSTLYELFGNKEGLLRAMVEEETLAIRATIGPAELALEFSEDGLVELAGRFVRAILAPRAVAVFRILATEGERLPDIAAAFFESGPRAIERQLAERFRRALPQLRVDAGAEQLVQVFLGAMIGSFHPRHLLGLRQAPLVCGIDDHVRLAVRIFLYGILPPQSSVDTAISR
ncbi:TetR/AcrR family transcriptional regulator [Magnetospirillum sp. 64-120]|uniref:TetR/AcrR family transcriptional regulator n=1 Tax=Magnetospirillum sp. 64-120 TaxID=1895778 RepID=UPI00092906A1|nr:TetR/AcrR family transcriptional regulator [Magnetospirillum sp. 64-120]OJX70256.1 MAG: hypothetical protein BGO92_06615 [Magnetospirillum sp. 64-120]